MSEALLLLAVLGLMSPKTGENGSKTGGKVDIEPVSVPELGVKHRLRLEQAL